MSAHDLGTAPTEPEGSPEHWRLVEELFDRASDLPEAERGPFLAGACGGDASLLAEVSSLLESADGAGSRLRGPIAAEADRVVSTRGSADVGRRLGPYRLVAPLGEGGMGVVYLAERDDDEYKRQVAIKILQHGLGSPQAVARFRDERQILAALEHPGIVRLLDGGRTEEGLPYLVLERVDGVPITRYASEHELKARPRVELVLRVCAALQYAHGKLVVHRDIKPSNLLVDRAGAPKLLDFGIAKLLDAGAELGRGAGGLARESSTRTGVALLTPEYASPEQARGEAVSVATDVYSLGAVLYELVTGRPPQQPVGGHLAVLRAICEAEPPRPSSIAPPSLRRDVAGDLDKIIEKALRKDPAERYPSIGHFADDLRRYLEGRPVTARAPTFGYRTSKFVRRHRGKVALAALVAGALAASTVVSVRQARRADIEAARARERADEVRKLAGSLLFEIDDAIRDLAGSTRARELVVGRALTYLDRLAAQPERSAALTRELALGYMKVGDIQGSPWDPSLGQFSEGLRTYQKATALLAGLDAADPETAAAVAKAAFGIGFMHYASRDIAAARASLTEALRRAREAPPGVDLDRVMRARAHLALAFDAKEENNAVDARRYADEGLAFVAGWPAHTDDARYWRAAFLLRRADAGVRVGDPGPAVAVLREVAAAYSALAEGHPNEPKYRREHAFALMDLGVATSGVGDSRLWAAHVGELDAAESAFGQALAIFERDAAADPDNVGVKMAVAILRTSLGLVAARRSPRDALPVFARALEAFDAIPAATRTSSYGRSNEFVLHCAMAHSLAAAGRPDARAQAALGLELAADAPFTLATCESLVARMERELGHPDAAAARLESVIRALGPLAAQPDTSALIGLVDALEQLAALRPADA
ncbi:MAG TPA: serine/threonine-protein kinase, partial [Polyangiaceae bacterium]|nr:serine/threonine-protein kinase [Polyangiaceae bacterium]